MTDNGQPAAPEKPRIVIEFAGPGEASSTITWSDGISTGQLYGAAWTLDAVAREIRAGEAAKGRGGLIAATPDLQALLGSLMGNGGPPRPPGAPE